MELYFRCTSSPSRRHTTWGAASCIRGSDSQNLFVLSRVDLFAIFSFMFLIFLFCLVMKFFVTIKKSVASENFKLPQVPSNITKLASNYFPTTSRIEICSSYSDVFCFHIPSFKGFFYTAVASLGYCFLFVIEKRYLVQVFMLLNSDRLE